MVWRWTPNFSNFYYIFKNNAFTACVGLKFLPKNMLVERNNTVSPLHRTIFLKTLIRNISIFDQKLWQNEQFLIDFVQFFNNQQNFQIIEGMQPNYLGFYPSDPSQACYH